jgi:hypothetical protein
LANTTAPSHSLRFPSANVVLPVLIATLYLAVAFVQADVKLLSQDELVAVALAIAISSAHSAWDQSRVAVIRRSPTIRIGGLMALLAAALAYAAVRHRASRRTSVIIATVLCLFAIARQAACGYVLLQQRHAFLLFRDAVERTAAPGEPVIVDDPRAVLPLYRYSSEAFREQIVEPAASGPQDLSPAATRVFPVPAISSANLFRDPQERVLVAPPEGAAALDLEARGYSLLTQTVTVPWDRLAGVSTTLADAHTRILLAVPNSHP